MRGIPGRRPVDRKHRPDIGATVAASLTGELRFEIGQADMVGPTIGVDRKRMRAFVIGAVDEKPGGARRSHFSESDFLFTHASPDTVAHWAWGGCARWIDETNFRGSRNNLETQRG